MKDENIKEILDNIKSKYEDYYVQDIVSGNDLKLLLDYITNLQTIEQQYSAILSENAELQQELERYKNIVKLLKHFGENSLGIIYALKDNVEPTENEWLNLIEYEKYLKELKGE